MKQNTELSPGEKLTAAVGDFREFIEALPESERMEKAWGAKETLAHLVFGLESYVAQVQAVLAGKKPEPPHGRFDEINTQAVTASRGASFTEFLQRHQTACNYLVTTAAIYNQTEIIFTLKKGSSFRRNLAQYMAAEAGHIHAHHQMLERQYRREYLSDVDKLQQTVADFCQFVHSQPKISQPSEMLEMHELLASLLFWHEQYLGQIEGILAQKPVAELSGTRKVLQDTAVFQHHHTPTSELLRRFQSANDQLCAYGRTLDVQNIILTIYVPARHRFTLDYAITRIEKHIHTHYQKLVVQTKMANPASH